MSNHPWSWGLTARYSFEFICGVCCWPDRPLHKCTEAKMQLPLPPLRVLWGVWHICCTCVCVLWATHYNYRFGQHTTTTTSSHTGSHTSSNIAPQMQPLNCNYHYTTTTMILPPYTTTIYYHAMCITICMYMYVFLWHIDNYMYVFN